MTLDLLRAPTTAAERAADHGLQALQAGDFTAALGHLRRALAENDTRPATVLNLAIAEDRVGDRERAQRLIRIVAQRLPDWDEPQLRLAESFRADGDRAAAEQSYRQTLAINPNRPEALLALAGLLLIRDAVQEAQSLLQRCCEVAPDNAEAWDMYGLTLRSTGNDAEALAAFIRAQSLGFGKAEYVVHGVEAAVAMGAAEDEHARLREACEQDPLNHALHAGRGIMLERLGRLNEAVDALEVAYALAPEERTVLRLLAGLTTRANQMARAETLLRALMEAEPENAKCRNDYAVVLMRLHRHPEARAILKALLDEHGTSVAVGCNLANATTCTGLQDEAVAIAREMIAMDPNAALPRRVLCNTLPYQHGTSGTELLHALQACSKVLSRTPQPPLTNVPDPERKLNVGLLSGTLRSHPVGWLTVAGIENLDPAQFSITCLVQNVNLMDRLAHRYRLAAAKWIEVDTLDDIALCTLAREQGIDVLIDLGGYGDVSRMPACANRLAPVQIKWVGMQSHTSGLAEMDWFITDRWETPPGFERFYSERLLSLRDGYICYSPPPYAPDVTPSPALRNGYLTFGCFNNLAKMTPHLIRVWAEILRRIGDARLVLKTHQLTDKATCDRLRGAFAELGIAADRLEMRGSSGHRAFMGEYGGIDIALDPFPYSGGLTTCEALWMGVPTITCPGEIFASRHSVSHMSNAGYADWVADSVDDYVEMAVAWSNDLPRLAALRAGMRERVRRSPICDAPRFGQSLGAAIRHAWREYCANPGGKGA